MNILLMSRILGKTGVGNHIKELSEELSLQGHKVWIISSTNEIKVGGTDINYIQINLRTKNLWKVIKNLQEIHQIITMNKIEIVHCHHRMASLYMKLYNIFWKIPYIWTLHLAPIPHDFIHKKFTFYGNKVIAISKEVGDFLNKELKISPKDISYVLNGVDSEKLKNKYQVPKDKMVIALHSRIDSVKNHIAVVEAVSLLSSEEKEKIVIVCSGEKKGQYYEELIKKIEEKNLKEQFIFCGWISAREILGMSDLMLLPSLKEGFALNCIEAMFMNVPVIRTKTSGYEDMKEYCIGLENTKSETIVEYIKKILEGSININEKIYKANEFVNKYCTINEMTKNTVRTYKEVLDKL